LNTGFATNTRVDYLVVSDPSRNNIIPGWHYINQHILMLFLKSWHAQEYESSSICCRC